MRGNKNIFSKVPENRTAVDNILRVNHGNQMRLNLMADAKANIMITVASVVFSIAIANLDNELVKWPLLTFAFGCFFALLFAIFAIIPKTDYPKDVRGDIDRKSPLFNPLFFGHFAHLPIEEYKEDYAETLMSDDSVYDAMAGDIYGQGKVLALRKYKFLKWSYMSFLLGMMSAMLIFISDLSIFMSVIEMVQSQFDDAFWRGFKEGLCNITRGCRVELLPHNL
jgi:hypothetical protein